MPSQSYCQGMATKHAARALVNLFSPDLRVCVGMEPVGAHDSKPGDPDYVDECANDLMNFRLSLGLNGFDAQDGSGALMWSAHYFYQTGTEKDASPLRLVLDADGILDGRGRDNIGEYHLRGY